MKYYLVDRYCKREDTNPNIWSPGWIGFLPIFGTKEHAQKFSEGKFDVLEMELKETTKTEPKTLPCLPNPS